LIEFKSIEKNVGGKEVLNRVSLTIARGQTHILLGPSGSGKTTLLKILMGLVAPTHGDVWIDGHNPRSMPLAQWVKRIGYVPQAGGLFPHLTVYENVTLVARAQKWPDALIAKRWSEITPLVSLHLELTNRFPKQISGGEAQRVAILRALFLDPEFLVLDEPLSALDPVVRSGMQSELKGLFDRLQKTVVIVTHDIAEAAYLGNCISLLHAGTVLQTGSFSDLRDHPAHPYVSEFVRSQRSLFDDGTLL
jgi:osmoprotectant transport system ATP-binding protein